MDPMGYGNPQIEDLKSSNILLSKPLRNSSQEPFAKVADFGLSRETNGAGAALTVQVGTWRWMAPEVFEPEEVDAKYNSKAETWRVGGFMRFPKSWGYPQNIQNIHRLGFSMK